MSVCPGFQSSVHTNEAYELQVYGNKWFGFTQNYMNLMSTVFKRKIGEIKKIFFLSFEKMKIFKYLMTPMMDIGFFCKLVYIILDRL